MEEEQTGVHPMTVLTLAFSAASAVGMFFCVGFLMAPFAMVMSFVSYFFRKSSKNHLAALISFFLCPAAFLALMVLSAATDSLKTTAKKPEPEPPQAKEDPGPPKPDIGMWRQSTFTDEMTDAKSIYAKIESIDQGILFTPSILVRCKNNQTDVSIDLQEGVAIQGNWDYILTLRFDNTKATKHTMTSAVGVNTTLFFHGPISIAKRMIKHDRLKIQYHDVFGKSQIVNWDLHGTEEALKPIREACHW